MDRFDAGYVMSVDESATGGGENRLLRALPPGERERLLADSRSATFALKSVLLAPGEPIDSVYFPRSGVVSLLTRMDDGSSIEIVTVGKEGIVGVPVFLGARGMGARDFYQVQVPGEMIAMSVGVFLKAARRDPLRALVQGYVQALFTQVTQQVACNGLHSVEERCSRWMLSTHDRVGSNEFPLTQEFLAQMLGVRRASVTVAAGILQSAGFIRYSRGRVTIIDREGLENSSCECYRIVRTEFNRLLP